ncbi:response regulator transcription factor [Thiomicrorhabdus cannonii]|uniref:response regulator transcription factor n=1 Tax=Thiomicrorhabdus cannonii TaxID=2748011 RepID=UPI0015BAD0D9|nr:response regulator transcription factor [Thiomicrorhabdus cannonii]
MTSILIYAQDPQALKLWLNACETTPKIIYDLESLASHPETLVGKLLLLHRKHDVTDELIEKLAHSGMDILLFSNQPSLEESVNGFKLGIKGYLNTFASSERIKQAIKTIGLGHIWLGQNIMQAFIHSLTPPSISSDSWKLALTDREIEVTALVMEGKSNKEIAEALEIAERTVKAHLQHIFQKLDVKDRLSLALKIQKWHD